MVIKLVVLDLDGTVVKYNTGNWHSSWDAIITVSGKKEKYDKLAQYYYPKRELYPEWISKVAQLLDGCRLSDVEKVIFPPPYVDGVRNTLDSLKEKNCVCGLLTSGVDIVADRVKRELYLDFAVSNRLGVAGGIFSGRVENVVDLWQKHRKLIELCRKYDISLDNTLFIGDHENDISSMKACGHSIAFNPATDEVLETADVSFDSWSEIKKYLEDRVFV